LGSNFSLDPRIRTRWRSKIPFLTNTELFGCLLVAHEAHAQDSFMEHVGQEAHFPDLLTAGDLTSPLVQPGGDLRLKKLLFLLACHRFPFTLVVSKLVKDCRV